MTKVRLPFEPVKLWLERNHPEVESLADAALIFGVSKEAVRLWIRDGVNVWRADEIAIHQMGRMPYEVWPDWEEMADLASGRG